MIYDVQTLKKMYKNYSNINQKICLEVKQNRLIRIKRGLYSDDLINDAPVIANICYSPSYLSFEYALSYYGIIPEYVSTYTSAVFAKKNNKTYQTTGARFEYNSIPDEAFSEGITFLKNDRGIRYKIATKEKAICDKLYLLPSIRSIKDLKEILYKDLRIDFNELAKLDFGFIKEIFRKYHSNTLNTFVKYIEEEFLK